MSPLDSPRDVNGYGSTLNQNLIRTTKSLQDLPKDSSVQAKSSIWMNRLDPTLTRIGVQFGSCPVLDPPFPAPGLDLEFRWWSGLLRSISNAVKSVEYQ